MPDFGGAGEFAPGMTESVRVSTPDAEHALEKRVDLSTRALLVPFPSPDELEASFEVMTRDRHQAMTDAKAGRAIERAECENPVQAHFEAGRHLGVRGTPTVVTEDGDTIGGYVPHRELVEMLEHGWRCGQFSACSTSP